MTSTPPSRPAPGPVGDDVTASPGVPGPPPGAVAGEIEILPGVVEKVASLAAREMAGVVRLGGGGARGVLRRGAGGASGVEVELDRGTAVVGLQVEIEYGVAAPDLMRALRDHVASVVESLTGLTVARVDVTVTDVHAPGEAAATG